MVPRWEYTTTGLKIVTRRDRGGAFFSHHSANLNFDENSVYRLTHMGEEGWELVSVIPMRSGTGGPDHAIGVFKRPIEGSA